MKDVFIPIFIGNAVFHIVLWTSVYKKRGKLRELYLFSCMEVKYDLYLKRFRNLL